MSEGAGKSLGAGLLLSSMPVGARDALLAKSHRVAFAAGMTIFSRGESGTTMIVIEDGRVEISLTSLSGRRSVLNHMGPGEVVGEIALLDGGERSADVTAATDVTGRLIHRRDLLALLALQPEAAIHLISELCAKVRNASDMFAVQSETRAEGRLASCLLRLGEKWGSREPGGAVRISGSFSQSDLGAFSGLARENVNRHLRRWVVDGVVELGADGIVLHRPEALEEYSDS